MLMLVMIKMMMINDVYADGGDEIVMSKMMIMIDGNDHADDDHADGDHDDDDDDDDDGDGNDDKDD